MIFENSLHEIGILDYFHALSILVSSAIMIDVKGTDNISLISEELRLNATLENTDWKAIGQISIPRKTIKDVGGICYLYFLFILPCV